MIQLVGLLLFRVVGFLLKVAYFIQIGGILIRELDLGRWGVYLAER